MSNIKQVNLTSGSVLEVLINKDDGKNHRTALPPLIDVEVQMGFVNDNLIALGYTPIPKEEIAALRKAADEAWEGYVLPKFEEE